MRDTDSLGPRNFLKRLGDHPFLASAAIVIATVAIVAIVRGIVFETVDDYNIMMSLAGEKTGEPYWQLTFYNSGFALLQSLLYRLAPGVQWYSVLELCMICLSLTLLLGILVERLMRLRTPMVFLVSGWILLFLAAFLYPVQRMQFTTTAALLGMASCALLYSIDNVARERGALGHRVALSGMMLVLCLVERQSTGLCAALFWVSGFVRILALSKGCSFLGLGKRELKALAIGAVGTILACVFVTMVHESVLRLGDNASYNSYDAARVQYQDYPRPSFEEAKGMYERAGWNRAVYRMATSLIYLAPEINEESFESIVTSAEFSAASPGLKEAVKSDVKLVIENKAARGLFCVLLVPFAAGLICPLHTDKRLRSAGIILRLGLLGLVILAIAMSVLLCLSGRWVLRSFQTIALPLLACLMMVASEAWLLSAEESRGHGGDERSRLISVALASALLVLGAYFSVGQIREYEGRDAKSLPQMAAVERYAVDHPGNVYVHDYSISNIYNSYDPFRVHAPGDRPTNLIISGGSYTRSGCYEAQLKENGITSLDAFDLLEPGYYYVSASEDYVQVVEEYLAAAGRPSKAEVVEKLQGGAVVYRFVEELGGNQ